MSGQDVARAASLRRAAADADAWAGFATDERLAERHRMAARRARSEAAELAGELDLDIA